METIFSSLVYFAANGSPREWQTLKASFYDCQSFYSSTHRAGKQHRKTFTVAELQSKTPALGATRNTKLAPCVTRNICPVCYGKKIKRPEMIYERRSRSAGQCGDWALKLSKRQWNILRVTGGAVYVRYHKYFFFLFYFLSSCSWLTLKMNQKSSLISHHGKIQKQNKASCKKNWGKIWG